MKFVPTRIADVVLIKPKIFRDDRGHFLETWQEAKFSASGISPHFVQDNHSHSCQWTLRGLHYQSRQPQGKLVRVACGAVFDVAVDLRSSSSTFGQWVGTELNDREHHMLWVPPGFAHGFLALSETVDFLYRCTDFYAPQYERTIRWNDPQIGIEWPLPAEVAPLLATRDSAAGSIGEAECFP
jgi:dTDP-4-dehydrorhamnose 3,5-epimerase